MAKKRSQSMSIAQLEKALASTKHQIQTLKDRREMLLAQIAKVDKNIAQLAGEPVAPAAEQKAPTRAPAKPKKQRKLPKNTMSLNDAIVKVLGEAKKPLRVAEIAEAVEAAGYTTTSKTFAKQVSGIAAEEKRVEKVARGLFVLKKVKK